MVESEKRNPMRAENEKSEGSRTEEANNLALEEDEDWDVTITELKRGETQTQNEHAKRFNQW